MCASHSISILGTVGGTKYGIAKNANLIAVKVLNSQGSGSIADIVAGIDWVVSQPRSNGAVINMSLGSSRVNSAMNTAVDSAVAAGVTVVVAGGNANKDACRVSPASATNVITVGATGKDDTRASFSNYGKCIDIFAPGVDITSVSKLQGSTWTISGTSMASPHVAGVAALLLDENSTLIPAQIADRIRADATPDVVAGAGRKSPNFMLYTGTITGLITTLNPTTTPVPTTPPAPTSAPTSVPSLAPAPSCAAKSQPCNANSDCCSNKCKGQNGFCRGN
jgi:subtilisin family serine protease